MATPAKWSNQPQFQSFLLIGLVFFFLAQLLLLSPSSLEDDFSGIRVVHPKDLLRFLSSERETLSKEPFLKNSPPTYSMRDSILYSSEGGKPKLKLASRKANLYQTQQMAHLREVNAELPDRTRIEAREAIQNLESGEITFLGSVRITFPGGATLETEVARAELKPLLQVRVPVTETVRGSRLDPRNRATFTARGLTYSESPAREIRLLKEVRVEVQSKRTATILSDQARFTPDSSEIHFWMEDSRIIETQFVEVREPGFELKSRMLDLKLGSSDRLEEITASKDASFRDTKNPDRDTSGTGGRAIYRVEKNEITLLDFPQLYQDRDTITGDSITYNRDQDTVEVDQSNATYRSEKRKPESSHR